MTTAEIVAKIKEKNYLFDLMADGRVLFKKQNPISVENLHGSLEDYLNKIAEINKANQLSVQLFTPNGSSYKSHGFFLVNTLPVVASATTATKTVASATNIVATETQLLGPENKTNPKMEQYATKSEVQNAQLNTEVRFLNEKVAELTERNKKLEKTNDELSHDYRKLLTESETNKAKYELDFKQKELALMSESKKGLSGIIDEAKNLPPQAWEFFAGFMKDHPMNAANKPTNQAALEGTKHKDGDAQACIDAIVGLLISAPTEAVAKITMLSEAFVKTPEHLDMVYNKFFPEKKETTTA